MFRSKQRVLGVFVGAMAVMLTGAAWNSASGQSAEGSWSASAAQWLQSDDATAGEPLHLVAYQPPGAPAPAAPAAPRGEPSALSSLFAANARRSHSDTLYRAPSHFGDFFPSGGTISTVGMFGDGAVSDIPLAGGAGRVSIADNNKALTQDRVYFAYNHFANAMAVALEENPEFVERRYPIDRYTFGFEKAFFDGCWSVELRMPLTGEFVRPGDVLGVTGGSAGNLSVILKRMIYETDASAVAVGLGVVAPTGSDARFLLDEELEVHVRNRAVNLVPYIGFLRSPNHCFFYQGFLQLDVPTNGNPVDYSFIDPTDGSGSLGTLHQPPLLHLDLQMGFWVYRPCEPRILTGVAPVVELHYTTGLTEGNFAGDTIDLVPFQWSAALSSVTYRSYEPVRDTSNVTVGLHLEFARHTLARIGAAFPLRHGSARMMDSEVICQVEQRF